MKKLLNILFILIFSVIFSSCKEIETIRNYRGGIIIEKSSSKPIYSNLEEDRNYFIYISNRDYNLKKRDYSIVCVRVFKYEYELYNVGDTIK